MIFLEGSKFLVIEAHLALYCKEPISDNIKKWLIEVAKRGKKVNNNKDNDVLIEKKVKTINQSIKPHYKPLKFYNNNFVETELCNSALSDTVVSEINYTNLNKSKAKILSPTESDITITLQSLIDLLD
ncbi:8904_t:CDS:2 [Racocetra fulgida]|uniref:8904_t:CDS:1 n=1 Tax=Racocetra fulgida TaxID=60492 RepID=A0A9N8WD15_9GLOM|nr:8904_t:CDS:2 [Racocetra fulgida]